MGQIVIAPKSTLSIDSVKVALEGNPDTLIRTVLPNGNAIKLSKTIVMARMTYVRNEDISFTVQATDITASSLTPTTTSPSDVETVPDYMMISEESYNTYISQVNQYLVEKYLEKYPDKTATVTQKNMTDSEFYNYLAKTFANDKAYFGLKAKDGSYVNPVNVPVDFPTGDPTIDGASTSILLPQTSADNSVISTIPRGYRSYAVPIYILSDEQYSGNQTFQLDITDVSNPDTVKLHPSLTQTLVTIRNDDDKPVPEVTLTPASQTILEGDAGTKTLTFTVTRPEDTLSSNLSFKWSITPVSETLNKSDFANSIVPNGVVTFLQATDQSNYTKTFSVNIQGDTIYELDEEFAVNLVSTNTKLAKVATPSIKVMIQNDDIEPIEKISIQSTSISQKEGTNLTGSAYTDYTYTVTRSENTSSASTVDYAVNFSVVNENNPDFANAEDFLASSVNGTVIFTAGQTSQTFTISVFPDARYERSENFTVTLSNPSNIKAEIINSTASGKILNDDILSPFDIIPVAGLYQFAKDDQTAVFESNQAVTADDTNDFADIFSTNIVDQGIQKLSITTSGVHSNAESHLPTISNDAKYVTFESLATNLVSTATVPTQQIYIKNLSTGAISLVSGLGSTVGNLDSSHAEISADGLSIVFQSDANNLITTDTNNSTDIYVAKWNGSAVSSLTLVSKNASGEIGNNNSALPHVSNNGNNIVFESDADNLVANDINTNTDVFVKNLTTNEVKLVSTANDLQSLGKATKSRITADSRYVTYQSDSDNLVANDINQATDIFVTDLFTNETLLASNQLGTNNVGNSDSRNAKSSDDGRFIIFESTASNLVENDTNGVSDIFIKDMLFDKTYLVGEKSPLIHENTDGVSISPTGKYVSFGLVQNGSTAYYLSANPLHPDFDGSATKLSIAVDPTDSGYTSTSPYILKKIEGSSNGTTKFTFKVTRTGDLTSTTTADYRLKTPRNPNVLFRADAGDFVEGVTPTGTITFAPNETSKQITINIKGDTVFENDEIFELELKNALNADPALTVSLLNPSVTAMITNDDVRAGGVITVNASAISYNGESTTLANNALSFNEDNGDLVSPIGNTITVTLTRSGNIVDATTIDYKVNAVTTNSADANDFLGGALPSGSITFKPAELTKTFTIEIDPDLDYENNENFTINFSSTDTLQPSFSTKIITATILNNDELSEAPTISLDSASDTGLSTSDLYTADTTPTFKGITKANGIVNLYYKLSTGTIQKVNTTADANGNWSYTFGTALANGLYDVYATVQAGITESNPSSTLGVTIDTALPTTASVAFTNTTDSTITDPYLKDLYINASERTNGFNVDVKLANNDLAVGDKVSLYLTTTTNLLKEYTVTQADVTNGKATINIPSTLALGTTDGSKRFYAKVTDKAGNIGTISSPFTFTLDTTAPLTASSLPLTTGSTTDFDPVKNPSLTLTYQEGLSKVDSSKVTLIDSASKAVSFSTSISTSGLVFSITPTTVLQPSASYNVTVGAGAVYDMAGNPSPAIGSYGFTTNAYDQTSASLKLTGDYVGVIYINVMDGAQHSYKSSVTVPDTKIPAGDNSATKSYLLIDVSEVFSSSSPAPTRSFVAGTNGLKYLASQNGDDVTTGTKADIIVLNTVSAKDSVRFNSALNDSATSANNVDTITYFDTSTDRFELDTTIFNTLGLAGTKLSSNKFESYTNGQLPAQAVNAGSSILALKSTSSTDVSLYWDADGSGTTASPTRFAVLTNITGTLSANNFNLVQTTTGFNVDTQKVSLSLSTFTGLSGTVGGALNSSNFELNSTDYAPTQAKNSTNPTVIADISDKANISLYWDADGSGTASAPTRFATLISPTGTISNFSSSNFTLVA